MTKILIALLLGLSLVSCENSIEDNPNINKNWGIITITTDTINQNYPQYVGESVVVLNHDVKKIVCANTANYCMSVIDLKNTYILENNTIKKINLYNRETGFETTDISNGIVEFEGIVYSNLHNKVYKDNILIDSYIMLEVLDTENIYRKVLIDLNNEIKDQVCITTD